MYDNDFGLTAPVRQAAIFVKTSKQITNPARAQLLRAPGALFPNIVKENDALKCKEERRPSP